MAPIEDRDIIIAQHDQHIKSLQHQVDDLKDVVEEVRKLSGTLIELTVEIKRTNDSVERHEKEITENSNQIDRLKSRKGDLWDKLMTILLTALVSGVVGYILAMIFK
jgi:chromosome segregation ATPase